MAAFRKVMSVALLWLAWMAGPAAAETLVVCSAATDKTLVVFKFDRSPSCHARRFPGNPRRSCHRRMAELCL